MGRCDVASQWLIQAHKQLQGLWHSMWSPVAPTLPAHLTPGMCTAVEADGWWQDPGWKHAGTQLKRLTMGGCGSAGQWQKTGPDLGSEVAPGTLAFGVPTVAARSSSGYESYSGGIRIVPCRCADGGPKQKHSGESHPGCLGWHFALMQMQRLNMAMCVAPGLWQ